MASGTVLMGKTRLVIALLLFLIVNIAAQICSTCHVPCESCKSLTKRNAGSAGSKEDLCAACKKKASDLSQISSNNPRPYTPKRYDLKTIFRNLYNEYAERHENLERIVKELGKAFDIHIRKMMKPGLETPNFDFMAWKKSLNGVEGKIRLFEKKTSMCRPILREFKMIMAKEDFKAKIIGHLPDRQNQKLQAEILDGFFSKRNELDAIERQCLRILNDLYQEDFPIGEEMLEYFPFSNAECDSKSARRFDFTESPQAHDRKIFIVHNEQGTSGNLKFGSFDFEAESYKKIGASARLRMYSYAIARSGGTVYIIGGEDDYRYYSRVYSYNTATHMIHKETENLLMPRAKAAATVFKGKLYVAGGKTGIDICTNTVERWNFGASWEPSGRLCYARMNFALVVIGGNLFAMGGSWLNNALVDEIEIFDEKSKTWSVHGEMKYGRAGFSAVAVGRRVYIAGGWQNDVWPCAGVRSWSPETGMWRSEASMNVGRKRFELALSNKGGRPVVYAIRGYTNSSIEITKSEKLELTKNCTKWKPV